MNKQQLASMFSRIDNLITLHQRKHYSLIYYERAARDRMTMSTSWFSNSLITCRYVS